MEEKGRNRHDDSRKQGAGVRVPVPGESSSSGVPPAFDSPTIIDVPGRKLSERPLLNLSSDMPTMDGSAPLKVGAAPFHLYGGATILEPGTVLGQRYEIIQMLGIGGMGAVYQARDLELNRTVALKVIRPDLAGNQSIIDRFKQELILATQVTHKNVIRIYDLGESDGLKFITMEFIEGKDLRSLIQEHSKVPAADAVEIMQQVCRALDAAHGVGVIHRDLKPQNIMRDVHGRVVVMDFGLARTLGGDGMTQSGALVGTMEYMSPEQALARELDQRSDIFSLGVIFYELLSGAIPFQADSALASLIKRTQERVVPVSDLEESIPAPLSAIVSRCLERDLELRYQSAAALLDDLDAWQGKRPVSAPPITALMPEKAKHSVQRRWMIGGSGLLVVAGLLLAAYLLRRPAVAHQAGDAGASSEAPAMIMAVLPLHNATGDPKLDWLGPYLAETLTTDVGQSAQLHTLPSERLHQVLGDLQVTSGAAIDAEMLKHVVDLTHTDIAVSGQYVRLGEQIQIDARVQDFKNSRNVAVKATAANDQALAAAVDTLADEIRKSLDFSTNQVNTLKAQAFRPSSVSLDALKQYNEGMEFLRTGRNLDAATALRVAVNADPQFALAYAALSETQLALGHQADAEQSSRRASELANGSAVSPIEKLLIDANRAVILNDNKRAIALYVSLSQAVPGNTDVQYALGRLYADTGDYEKARAVFVKMLATDPNNVLALWRAGAVELQSGHFQAALEPLSKGQYLTVQTDNQEQRATILLAMGIAYQFLQKRDEALRYYNDSIAIAEKIGQRRAVAAALGQTAQMQMTMGKSDAALLNFKKALAIFEEIGSTKEAGDTLSDMAMLYQSREQNEEALKLFRQALQIERDAGDQNREALCLNTIASLNLAKGDTESAFTYFQQALQLGEKIGAPQRIADPLQGLGDAYMATGRYDEALASLKRALDTWRGDGNAIGVASTQRQMGIVFGYQARFGAAVDAIQQAVKGFEALGDRSSESAQALQGLAEALARAGRGDESGPYLDQAERMANELKNETILAKVLGTRGDIALYRGDTGAAAGFFQPALADALRGGDRDSIVEAKLNLGRLAIAQGHGAEAVKRLRPLVGSDITSDRNLALQASVVLAEALIQTKDYEKTRQLLQDAAAPAEKSGMRLRLARIYYLQATTSRLSGSSGEAWNEYRQALTLLDRIRNDAGSENILRRNDLKAIFDDCSRWVGDAAGKSKS